MLDAHGGQTFREFAGEGKGARRIAVAVFVHEAEILGDSRVVRALFGELDAREPLAEATALRKARRDDPFAVLVDEADAAVPEDGGQAVGEIFRGRTRQVDRRLARAVEI